ncbi:MAG: LytTR family DNA-binding domain-containing protein [Bacteroidota bacterium]
MPPFKTVIIEDHPDTQELLLNLISKYGPDYEVVARAENVQQGVHIISSYQPDIVFLDIQMPDGTGFDLLQNVNYGANNAFEIVFVTAHEQFAINAFKFAAFDYLLKPIRLDELQKTLDRLSKKLRRAIPQGPSPDLLSEHLPGLQRAEKMAVPCQGGFEIIKLKQLVFLQSDRNYTMLHLDSDKKIISSRTLKVFDELLNQHGFFRIHQSFLINLDQVIKYSRQNGGEITMKGGAILPIALRRKETFLNIFKHLFPRK